MIQQRIHWKAIVLFLITFCMVLVVACIPFYSLLTEGYQFYEVKEKEKEAQVLPEDSIDVAFFGDSESWAAILPKVLYEEYGIASYNFGTPGQCTYDTICLAKKILMRQKPEVLVLEASTLYSSPNTLKFLVSQYIPIFHYHSFYRNVSIAQDHHTELGANTSDTIEGYTGTLDYMQANGNSNPLGNHSTTYLQQLLELCKENEITLQIISVPSALTWSQGKHDAVSAWCEENQVSYRDYNQTVTIDWTTDTRDGGDHLNTSGAEKTTKEIGKDFIEVYQMNTVQADHPFAQWVSTLD